jgi:general secretion pathway protein J
MTPSDVGAPGRSAGFTLLELLVAMGVFAILAATGYFGMAAVLKAKDRLSDADERLSRLQKVVALVEGDLRQALSRPIRDELGSDVPAFVGGTGTGRLFALTKGGGWLRREQSSTALSRVEYAIEGAGLVRLVWPVLDRTPGAEPQRQVLLEGLDKAGSRFRRGRDWVAFWPQPAEPTAALTQLPRAVELALDMADGSHYRFVVAVGG